MSTGSQELGWVVQESGPPSADRAVLLLPAAVARAPGRTLNEKPDQIAEIVLDALAQ